MWLCLQWAFLRLESEVVRPVELCEFAFWFLYFGAALSTSRETWSTLTRHSEVRFDSWLDCR